MSVILPLLPSRSSGVLAAPLGDLVVLYDLLTEVVHVLNASAGLVWMACDGSVDLADAVDLIVEATGAEGSVVERDVAAGVDQLAAVGLVGRQAAAPVPVAVERLPVEGAHASAVHPVLDDGVRFHSDDEELLVAIDAQLGVAGGSRATIDLGAHQDDDGSVALTGWGAPVNYASREAFLRALPSALNQIGAATTTCIALHAGGVRAPTGEVLLLPARSGSGKTTLTAALVRAGWDYASDEAIGVRDGSLQAVAYPKPLVLDLASQALLGLPPTGTLNVPPAMLRPDAGVLHGEVGRVGLVVLPRFERGSPVTLSTLEPAEAIVGLLEHALNLARVGQPGLDALCQLALAVPVHRLVHGGIADALPALDDLLGLGP